MRQLLSATVFGLLMLALRIVVPTAGEAAADKPAATAGEADKEAARKDIKVNLVVQVSGGDPAKALRNAEVSVMGVDGTELADRKHTDGKGEARFQDLSNGEVTIIVIAKGRLEDFQSITDFQQTPRGAHGYVAATGLITSVVTRRPEHDSSDADGA